MVSLLNSWQFYVALVVICDVVFTQSYKLAVQKTKNDTAATILMETLSGFSILFLVPFFPFLIPTSPLLYAFFFISTFFAAIQDRLKTTARKFIPASETAMLNELYSVFVIIIGFVAFRQPFILIKAVGALLIFGANALLVYRKGKFVFNTYTIFMVIACIALAISLSLDIGFSKYFNIPLYIFLSYLTSAVILMLVTKTKISEVKKEFITSQRKYYVLASIAWALTFFSIVRAAQLGPIAVVIPLGTLSVLLNVVTAIVVHKETNDIFRKIIAAVIIIIGVTLTVI